LYFGYGRDLQHEIAVLDERGKLRAQLPAPGIPRGLVLDPLTHRLYAGFSELNTVVVFDVANESRIASWTLDAPAAATFPLALDQAGNRLFVAGRSGDQIAVIDSQTGRLLQNIAAPGDAATLAFDPAHRELYVPGGIGQLAVYKEDDRGLLHEVERIPTRHGARSGLLDPESGRYYLAVPAYAGKPAEVRVYLVVEPSAGVGS
jgi:DNA-binding beta-propeller fold protein YncE